MPAYSSDPSALIPQAMPGQPIYVWGSFDDRSARTRFLLDHVALTSNVATVTGTIVEGNIPAIGELITIQGSTAASGVFNVTAVALTAVSITAATGKGTVSFALTNANVASTADAGNCVIQRVVQFEAVSTNENSAAVSLSDFAEGTAVSGFSAEVVWALGTSAGAVGVQVANKNDTASYQTISTITYPNTRFDPAGYSANFARLVLSTALTGATTIAARILLR